MANWFDRIATPCVRLIPKWIRPNHLTIIRGLLVFPVIYWKDQPSLTVATLVLSSFLDILDGVLARVRKQTSEDGAMLDALSDKIFIHGSLWFACGTRVTLWIRATLFALDLVLTGMRPLKRKRGVTSSSNKWGALKTWSQSFAIAFVLSQQSFFVGLSHTVFIVALLFALMSLRGHIRDLKRKQ